MIEISIDPQFETDIAAQDILAVARAVLKAESMPDQADLSIVITDDTEIQSLNAQFRHIDAPTDVLAFVEQDTTLPFVHAPDELPYLGDVIISFPRAQAQAQEQGHSVWDEVSLLIVHGMLHLLGYDHDTLEQEQQMWARQDLILAHLKV